MGFIRVIVGVVFALVCGWLSICLFNQHWYLPALDTVKSIARLGAAATLLVVGIFGMFTIIEGD